MVNICPRVTDSVSKTMWRALIELHTCSNHNKTLALPTRMMPALCLWKVDDCIENVTGTQNPPLTPSTSSTLWFSTLHQIYKSAIFPNGDIQSGRVYSVRRPDHCDVGVSATIPYTERTTSSNFQAPSCPVNGFLVIAEKQPYRRCFDKARSCPLSLEYWLW